MNKALLLRELTRIGFKSDGGIIKRCVLCSSDMKSLDDDCPVCRAIKYLKASKRGTSQNQRKS